jgi:O-succinylbenzoic acid--CoA ligase
MPASPTHRLVTIALPPGDDFIAALDEAWARGDAVLPLDPRAPAAVADRLVEALRPGEPVADDVALVIATSGSTGEPKGVQLSHAALEASARATHQRIGLEAGDRWLACMPWQHIGGIQVLLRARLLDIPLVVHDRFDPDRIAAAEATLTSLVPTQLGRLLDAGVDLSAFRAILLGGAAATPALLARAAAAGARVVPTYGMSETSGGCVYDGRPLEGIDAAVDHGGRILLRGPTLMSGYRLRPDLTREAFSGDWFVTSDLGQLDQQGRLQVTGRVDDVVITGGEKVVAAEVAEVLGGHPDIREVVVTGVTDAEWGQRVVAVVVPRDGAQIGLADLRVWCGDRMAAAARPREVVVVDEIPRLGSGKPDRLAVSRLVRHRSSDADSN